MATQISSIAFNFNDNLIMRTEKKWEERWCDVRMEKIELMYSVRCHCTMVVLSAHTHTIVRHRTAS